VYFHIFSYISKYGNRVVLDGKRDQSSYRWEIRGATRCGGRKLQAEKKTCHGKRYEIAKHEIDKFCELISGKRHVQVKREYLQDGRRPRLYGGPYSFFDGVDQEHRL